MPSQAHWKEALQARAFVVSGVNTGLARVHEMCTPVSDLVRATTLRERTARKAVYEHAARCPVVGLIGTKSVCTVCTLSALLRRLGRGVLYLPIGVCRSPADHRCGRWCGVGTASNAGTASRGWAANQAA